MIKTAYVIICICIYYIILLSSVSGHIKGTRLPQLFRLDFRSLLGNPMGPLEIPYPIGFLIPHWKSGPPRIPMGYWNSNGCQYLYVPSEFPYPMRFPMTLIIPYNNLSISIQEKMQNYIYMDIWV